MKISNPQLKVAFIGHTAALSGGEIGLLRLLQDNPHVAAHVILAEDGPLVARLEATSATVELLPLAEQTRSLHRDELRSSAVAIRHARSVLRYSRQLAARLQELQPDLVHTNTLKAGLYGVLAGRAARIPVIWGLHDRLAGDYLPAPAAAAMRWAVRTLPSGLVVPSQSTLDIVGTVYRPGLKRAVIPLPIPLPATTYPVHGLIGCVGVIGRLAPWKGQDLFLRAFAAAFPVGEVRARIVGSALFGEDDFTDSLRALARDLGIADRVDFMGFRSDIDAQLGEMDILVSSSVLPETLGQVIVEAMGAGVPTIAARAGGPLEYVRDGESGLLYDQGDRDSLAAALRRLADDRELRRRISVQGQAVASGFSAEATWAKLLHFYGRVTGRFITNCDT